MKSFDEDKYKEDLALKPASFLKKELMAMEKRRNHAVGKMLDLESRYSFIEGDYLIVRRYLDLKETLDEITDHTAAENFKKEKNFEQAQRDYDEVDLKLKKDPKYKQSFDLYAEHAKERYEAIAKIDILEREVLTKNYSEPSLVKKTWPLLASILAAASLGASTLAFFTGKDNKAELKEPVKMVQKGIQKPAKSTSQVKIEEDKSTVLKGKFEEQIKKYSPDTQMAMHKAILWLQKGNDFFKAVAKNDISARTTAKIEMNVLRSAIQTLDKNVWLAINEDISRIFVDQNKKNPGGDFDLSYAYQKMVDMYEKRVKAEKNPNIQLYQKMGIVPILNEDAVVVGDFDKAVDLAVDSFKNIDTYFALYAQNPKDERLPALQKGIDKTAIQISQNQPAMFLFFVSEVETTFENYNKTGKIPEFNEALCRSKFKQYALSVQENPEKTVQVYKIFFKLNEEKANQRPAISRDAR